MEPEFQAGQTKGENSFSGGNFAPTSNNRFLTRRGRLRTSYLNHNKDSLPVAEINFELDATQKGISINEWWRKIYENKWELLSLSAGMLVRPFGNDVQLKYLHATGATELRAEYWQGTQTGFASSSETPLQEPYFIREFKGVFISALFN